MMLGSQISFLVLQRAADPQKRIVQIVRTHAEALKGWQPSTRLSPIFGVEEHGTSQQGAFDLEKTRHLIFLGPVHPEVVSEQVGTEVRLWLTLGLFNVVVAIPEMRKRKRLLSWAEEHGIHYEAWTLNRRHILQVEPSASNRTRSGGNWQADLAKLSERSVQEELQ